MADPLIRSLDERLLTSEEVAELARMTRGAFHNLRHRGEGPRGARVGKRVLYSEGQVLAWLNSRVEPVEAQRRGGDAA